MTKIITEDLRTSIANDFYESFAEDSVNNYYVFASSMEQSENTIRNTQEDKRIFQKNVIFGRKVSSNDVRYMFNRNPWQEGVIYDSFDDTKDITTMNFYVTVVDGDTIDSPIKVYKCIRNGDGNPSTSRPSTSDVDLNNETLYEDGYVWKFMFEVPVADYSKYSTIDSLPYVENISVINNAVANISDIVIEKTKFELFKDLLLGNCNINAIVTEEERYKLEVVTENTPKAVVDAYVGMYIRTSDGTIHEIISSSVPTNNSTISNVLNLYVSLSDTDIADYSTPKQIEVVPKIEVSESPGERCIAYGILDENGTLDDIEFDHKGTDYILAKAKIVLPEIISEFESENELRVIVSSENGHGSNPIKELYMSKLSVVSIFGEDGQTNIPNSNFYSKIGIVKNPKFRDSSFPLNIDNRLILTTSGDVTSFITLDNYIKQGDLMAKVHEIAYNFDENATTIKCVDYDCGTGNQFVPGNIDILDKSDLSNVGTISIDNFDYGNYLTYTGKLLHFVDFSRIERNSDKREKIKLTFDF